MWLSALRMHDPPLGAIIHNDRLVIVNLVHISLWHFLQSKALDDMHKLYSSTLPWQLLSSIASSVTTFALHQTNWAD